MQKDLPEVQEFSRVASQSYVPRKVCLVDGQRGEGMGRGGHGSGGPRQNKIYFSRCRLRAPSRCSGDWDSSIWAARYRGWHEYVNIGGKLRWYSQTTFSFCHVESIIAGVRKLIASESLLCRQVAAHTPLPADQLLRNFNTARSTLHFLSGSRITPASVWIWDYKRDSGEIGSVYPARSARVVFETISLPAEHRMHKSIM